MFLPRRKLTPQILFILLLISLVYYIKPNLPKEIQAVLPELSPTQQPPTLTLTPLQATMYPTLANTGSVETVTITRVIDGDTIEIDTGQKVRYIGVNSPESVDPRRTVQCFGKEASQRNKELVEGKIARLEKDINETDRYGRLLRYVYVEDMMINEQLVREGYALATAYPPDVKHQERLNAAQKEAQENKQGLWSTCK